MSVADPQTASLDASDELDASHLGEDDPRLVRAPSKRKNLLLRALSSSCSPRSAIKAFCQQCVGYSELPKAVANCSAKQCPLHAFRPYQPVQ